MTKMAMSVKMVEAALAIQVATWLMQWPGISGYHSLLTGTQMKMKMNMMVKPQQTTKMPMPMQMRRMRLVWKIRMYMSRRLSFVQTAGW